MELYEVNPELGDIVTYSTHVFTIFDRTHSRIEDVTINLEGHSRLELGDVVINSVELVHVNSAKNPQIWWKSL